MTRERGSSDFNGRLAVVTGASSGIGRETAMLLAARGARVLAVGRNAERLDALGRDCDAEVLAVPLERDGACEQVIDRARRHGPVAILVNCAGRPGYLDRPIFEQTPEDWRATMAINLDAPFELTRRAAHDMRRENWGRIVMVSSTAGEHGAPAMSAYCASKHGLIGLMRSIAQDVAPHGTTCNAVLPGWVKTDMADRDAEREAERRGTTASAVWEERAAASPARRILEPKEVAKVIGFLVSEEASGINGEAITVSLGSVW